MVQKRPFRTENIVRLPVLQCVQFPGLISMYYWLFDRLASFDHRLIADGCRLAGSGDLSRNILLGQICNYCRNSYEVSKPGYWGIQFARHVHDRGRCSQMCYFKPRSRLPKQPENTQRGSAACQTGDGAAILLKHFTLRRWDLRIKPKRH